MVKKYSLFVPGRLCLFGEHSDWAGLQRVINSDIVPGASIVTGIEQGIYADVETCDMFVMTNISEELKEIWVDFESVMQVNELKKTAALFGLLLKNSPSGAMSLTIYTKSAQSDY